MRARAILLALAALLLVAGAVTAGINLTKDDPATRCNEETGRGCATATQCNPERPACQEQQRNARLRAFCAENPRDEKCRTAD